MVPEQSIDLLPAFDGKIVTDMKSEIDNASVEKSAKDAAETAEAIM